MKFQISDDGLPAIAVSSDLARGLPAFQNVISGEAYGVYGEDSPREADYIAAMSRLDEILVESKHVVMDTGRSYPLDGAVFGSAKANAQVCRACKRPGSSVRLQVCTVPVCHIRGFEGLSRRGCVSPGF